MYRMVQVTTTNSDVADLTCCGKQFQTLAKDRWPQGRMQNFNTQYFGDLSIHYQTYQ